MVLSKTNMRMLSVCLIIVVLGGWLWMCAGLLDDYMDIINHKPVVRVSVISLWVPIGFFGAMISIVGLGIVALVTGRQARQVIDAKWMRLTNKLCIGFGLLGVAFAAGWTYHSIDILGRYGYVYSSALTKITPTGIHLRYVHVR